MIYGSYSMNVSIAYHADGYKPEKSWNQARGLSHKTGRGKLRKYKATDIRSLPLFMREWMRLLWCVIHMTSMSHIQQQRERGKSLIIYWESLSGIRAVSHPNCSPFKQQSATDTEAQFQGAHIWTSTMVRRWLTQRGCHQKRQPHLPYPIVHQNHEITQDKKAQERISSYCRLANRCERKPVKSSKRMTWCHHTTPFALINLRARVLRGQQRGIQQWP